VEGRPVLSGGVLYGVLGYSAPTATGSVYALTPGASGTTWTQSTISSFTGGTTGGIPNGSLTADSSGNLYGATFGGGSTNTTCTNTGNGGCGIIYKLTKPASGSSWARSVVYAFTGGTDGIGPLGNLTADASGNLYGVTEWGGCTPTLTYGRGCGTVFKLTLSGGTYSYKQIYAFKGGSTDGAWPVPQLAVNAAGDVFGATEFGGSGAAGCNNLSGSPDGLCGVVFELKVASGKYTEAILHLFTDGTDGSLPSGGVVLDSKGNLYGTVLEGGTDTGLCLNFGYSGCGQVYKLAKPAAGSTVWTKTTAHNFTGVDGAAPAALLIDHKNKLYGETTLNSSGDSSCSVSYYCGTAFELVFAKGAWTQTVLKSFTGASALAGPEFGLAYGTIGTTTNLYGVTESNVTSTAFDITGSAFVPPLAK
jgi:uncharacterized protein YceK